MSKKIACIGVGNLGRAWAAIFARAGHEVALYDNAPGAVAAALPAIESTLNSMAEADLVEDVAAAMARDGGDGGLCGGLIDRAFPRSGDDFPAQGGVSSVFPC